MSLVVAINGKIQSYFSPKSRNVEKASKTTGSKEVSEFSDLIDGTDYIEKKKSPKQQLSTYEKVQKGVPKHRSRVLASDIMSKDVHTMTPDETIDQAISNMHRFGKNHYPIVEENFIVGIISDRDILYSKAKQVPGNTTLREIMSNEVVLSTKDADVRVLSKIMLEENFSCLPVINIHNNLVGIVTKTDLLKCIINNMPTDYVF